MNRNILLPLLEDLVDIVLEEELLQDNLEVDNCQVVEVDNCQVVEPDNCLVDQVADSLQVVQVVVGNLQAEKERKKTIYSKIETRQTCH